MSLSSPAQAEARKAPPKPLPRLAGWTAAGLVSLGALLFPALWNGFPLVFADTGGYLISAVERSLLIGRSALYGAFLAAGIAWDFWPNVVAQAAAAAWLIALALRAHGLGGRPRRTAAFALGLALATGLPWSASMLMPDVFASLAALALHLLAFRRDALRRAEAIGLVALVAFAVASHMATLALGAALFVAHLLVRPLAGRLRLPHPVLAWPALALAAGIALALFSNLVIAGRLAFTPGGIAFVFGRLVQDGIVARHLAERCPDPALRLCAYREALPDTADGWLWGWGSPLYKLGGPDAFAAEAHAIIVATLARHPVEHLAAALRAAARQLVRVRTGEGVNPHDMEHAVRALERYAPGVMPRFAAARQQQDLFDFTLLNRLHVPLALLALALLPAIVIAGARGRASPASAASAAFALSVIFALLANAAICGALSNPNDRYQSRLAWLAPFAVAVAVLSRPRGPAAPSV